MERKICKRCGNFFTAKGENTMCQYCIAIVLSEMHVETKIATRRKTNKKPQIVLDVIAATKAGLSYGYYMAWKEGRR